MQNLVTFVQEAIVSGVAGSVAYDGLKVVLGTSFDRLSTYISNDETAKFEGALEMLLEENDELRKQIEALKEGKEVFSTVINQSHTGSGDNVGGDKIVNSGVSIGGSNSGNIVTGDGNTL